MIERCESVRDRLPEFLHARLDEGDRRALRRHVAECEDCAAELHLLEAVQADRVTLPPELEARVLRAAGATRHRPRWGTPGRVAMAASVTLALVTAGVLQWRTSAGTDDAVEALAPPPWPSADEPLMRGGPALNQLSLDELESLLEELES